jgi:N-acetylglucosamine-6-sulfatase
MATLINKIYLCGIWLLLLFIGGLTAQAADRRPNIIFILADDHRYDALSCLGHPFVKTPNIDRIADEGVIFKNFFVTSSLCSPSRASFLTGAYPHNHGAVINDWCDPKLQTYPQTLRKLGYETGYVGKWHLARHNRPRTGFDYWFSFAGQGNYEKNTFNENGSETVIERYITDELNDRAISFINRKRDKPFALYLSHKAIHGPFTPAQRHRDLYASESLIEPPTWNDPMSDKPEEIRSTASPSKTKPIGEREAKLLAEAGKPVPRWLPGDIPDSLGPQKWGPKQQKPLNYYRAISAVDEGVGKIFRVLESKGLVDNTIIIYAGDNGFAAGEHRRYAGKRLGYEETMRVPFLMRYPGVFPAASEVNEMCLNIDLAPTLIEIAGGSAPKTVDGMSFLDIAQGKNVPWRKSFLYEYYREPWTQRFPTIIGVRTSDLKFLTYPDSKPNYKITDELYDLTADPLETTNLTADPTAAAIKKKMLQELENLKKIHNYRSWDFSDIYDPADSTDKPAEMWYEDNNQARAAGVPPDFKEKFEKPETWARARQAMDVYMIRANSLLKPDNEIDENFIRNTMAPLLKAADLPLAIDAGGATFRGAGHKRDTMERELELFAMLQDAGIKIRSVSLQSVLSKPLIEARRKIPYSMDKRFGDVLEYFQKLKDRFPDIEVGIIDALVPHDEDYESAYEALKEKLAARDLKLDHILLDCPFELPEENLRGNSWQKIKAVENYVKKHIGCDFGLICTSKTAGYKSDRAYHETILKILDRCRTHNIEPDYFLMMSWFPHPSQSIPDNAPEGIYPAMKTFLEFTEKYKAERKNH